MTTLGEPVRDVPKLIGPLDPIFTAGFPAAAPPVDWEALPALDEVCAMAVAANAIIVPALIKPALIVVIFIFFSFRKNSGDVSTVSIPE